jgi:hypothetical protein
MSGMAAERAGNPKYVRKKLEGRGVQGQASAKGRREVGDW